MLHHCESSETVLLAGNCRTGLCVWHSVWHEPQQNPALLPMCCGLPVQRVHIQATYWYYASKQPSLAALATSSTGTGATAGGETAALLALLLAGCWLLGCTCARAGEGSSRAWQGVFTCCMHLVGWCQCTAMQHARAFFLGGMHEESLCRSTVPVAGGRASYRVPAAV